MGKAENLLLVGEEGSDGPAEGEKIKRHGSEGPWNWIDYLTLYLPS